jgi:hypothetical protein
MSFFLPDLTAKIFWSGQKNSYAGTAWLCSPEYALTAAHCVVNLTEPATYRGPYRLAFKWGNLMSEEIAWLDAKLDAALLKITSGSTGKVREHLDGIRSMRELPALPPGADRRWTSFGFPLASQKGGLTLDGEVNEINARPYGEVTDEFAIQLTCAQGGFTDRYDLSGRKVEEPFGDSPDGGHLALDGASGSAVMHRNEIFGLIRSGPPMLGQKVIFAAPLGLMAERSPLVASVLEQHRQNHIEEVRRCWLGYEARERRELVEKHLEWRPDTFSAPSPLERHWKIFVNEWLWHEFMADYVAEASGFGKEEKSLSWLADESRGLDFDAPYERLAACLRVYTERCLSRLNQLATELETENRKVKSRSAAQDEIKRFEERVLSYHKAKGLLLNLKKFLSPPLFRRCFLVMGSSGSGKTHFIASRLAEDAPEEPRPFLVLLLGSPESGVGLEEMIVRGVRDASGDGRWGSLEEFSAFLGARREGARADADLDPLNLLIVLDGLEKWVISRGLEFDAELTTFIADHTRLHNVYWLVTLHDASYDKISVNAAWNLYSNVRSLPRVTVSEREYSLNAGGWYALDTFNRTDELGLRIIGEVQGRAASGDEDFLVMLDEMKRGDTSGAATRILSNPFIAWLLLDLLRDEDIRWNVLDLNIIAFIEKFWAKRLNNLRAALSDAKLNAAALDEPQLVNLVWAVARALCEFADLTPPRLALVKGIREWAEAKGMERSDEKAAESAVAILTEGNLLKKSEEGGANPTHPFGPAPPVKIEILFETFWEYYIARTLDPASFKDAAAVWGALEKTAQREDVRESVCIFFLMIIAGLAFNPEAADSETYEQLLAGVSRHGVETRSRLSAAVWFAAQKVDADAQRALAEVALGHSGDPLDSHALYGLMAFLGDADESVLDIPSRLRLMRPHYEQLRSASLSDFYYFTARRLLRQVRGRQALSDCMLILTGSEATGCAPQLAQLAVDLVRDWATDRKTRMLDFVIKYLQRLSGFKTLGEAPPGAARPYSFHECVLSQFCHQLVFSEEFRGLEAYWLLSTNLWYRPEQLSIQEPLAREMRQQANIELGRWYRQWIYTDTGYVKLVKELAGGDLRDRETAFYLIRHTIPMKGPQHLFVDKKFRPTLRKIFRDEEMKDILEKYRGLFASNLREARAKHPAAGRRAAAVHPVRKR